MLLRLHEVTKYYGSHPAVRDVSFSVAAGETVGFLGVNGAGKSTTMRMLTGYLPTTSGTVEVDGYDIDKHPVEARRRIGYLPENTPLYPDMRVDEFLHYRARLKRLSRRERKAEVAEALAVCRIDDVSHRLIGHLSKGYRQRVGLADTLLGKPPLLVLDEPTVGLDPHQVRETRSLVRQLGEARTVFLSSHILHEIELLCDRVLIIDGGRLVAEGRTEELRRRAGGARRLTVELFAESNVKRDLSGAPGVASAEEGDPTPEGARTFAVTCRPDEDPRPAIARLSAEKGWVLQEMRLEPVRLEEVFANLTGKEQREEASCATSSP